MENDERLEELKKINSVLQDIKVLLFDIRAAQQRQAVYSSSMG